MGFATVLGRAAGVAREGEVGSRLGPADLQAGSSGGADENGAEEAVRAVEVGCGPEESSGVDECRGERIWEI